MSQVRFHHIHHNTFKLGGVRQGMYWINNNSRNVISNNVFTGSCVSSAVTVSASNINNDVCFNTFNISTTTGHAIRTFGLSNNHNRIYGNVISVSGTGGCIYVYSGTLGWLASDANLFFFGPGGKLGSIGANSYTTLAAWQAATKATAAGQQDTNSIVGDPKFKSATDFHLTAASPAIGKAKIFAGRHDPVVDFDGYVRGTKQDMGAFETAGYIPYGAGCPDSASKKVPVGSLSGNVGAGDTVSLDLTNAKPSTPAFIAIGATRTSIGLGGSCILLTQPVIVFFIATDASGKFSLKQKLAPAAKINGVHAMIQFAVVDTGSPAGLAMSNGIDFRF